MENNQTKPPLCRAAAQTTSKELNIADLKRTYGIRKDLTEINRNTKSIAEHLKLLIGGEK